MGRHQEHGSPLGAWVNPTPYTLHPTPCTWRPGAFLKTQRFADVTGKNAGTELGRDRLAEAHQTLVINDLRDRVVVETDGQVRPYDDTKRCVL